MTFFFLRETWMTFCPSRLAIVFIAFHHILVPAHVARYIRNGFAPPVALGRATVARIVELLLGEDPTPALAPMDHQVSRSSRTLHSVPLCRGVLGEYRRVCSLLPTCGCGHID